MRLSKGDSVKHIQLPSIDETTFNTEIFKGKPFMISFFRFAGCPFCNLRIHEMVNAHQDNFNIVAIFDSPLDNLIKHSKDHHAPFPILADEKNIFYKKYGVEKSFLGMLEGMFLHFPRLMKGMLKGYLPTTLKGSLITMPADFLIDKNGKIHTAYYAKHEADHIPLETIKAFFDEQ